MTEKMSLEEVEKKIAERELRKTPAFKHSKGRFQNQRQYKFEGIPSTTIKPKTKSYIGYLIDTPNRQIVEVSYNGEIEDIYAKLGFGCTYFKGITINASRDCLYVDEEALVKAQTNHDLRKYTFGHKRYHSTLIGRGLVLGHDEMGDSADRPFIDIETLAREITFYGQDCYH